MGLLAHSNSHRQRQQRDRPKQFPCDREVQEFTGDFWHLYEGALEGTDRNLCSV